MRRDNQREQPVRPVALFADYALRDYFISQRKLNPMENPGAP
jgi:hypothetical protein